ncbi:hypothetical protein DFH08DRAFT_813693 [Mycena albidolilacea]|uniref:Uncharacterized protein n=1 Tax=Mycena albidolilacea TaxID=1033008 RepID=A0AAD6ZRY0_9AGAR|nr:hypothetical protein DFH08DRAFT_813693 [Mycena albidolilacea]
MRRQFASSPFDHMRGHIQGGITKGSCLQGWGSQTLAAKAVVGVWRPTWAANGARTEERVVAIGLAGVGPAVLDTSKWEELELEAEAECLSTGAAISIRDACRVEAALLIVGFGLWWSNMGS